MALTKDPIRQAYENRDDRAAVDKLLLKLYGKAKAKKKKASKKVK